MNKYKINNLLRPLRMWVVISMVHFIYNLVLFFDIISKPYLSALSFIGFANSGILTNLVIIDLICLTTGTLTVSTIYLLNKTEKRIK